jgi:Fe-S oxidoreductase
MKVFKAAGVEVEFPMEQTCCGLPLVMLGESKTAAEVARQNVAAFAGEYDAIVTLCASCASHLKHGYARLLGDDPSAPAFSAKVTDFSSFVHDRLGLNSFTMENSGEKVAYHASCHLCRGLGVKEAPRAIIKAAANYVHSPEEESCCGFGGSFSAKFPEISAELMRKKLANISMSGAKRLVLDCPGCAMQIGGGADRQHLGIRVSHIAELIADGIK